MKKLKYYIYSVLPFVIGLSVVIYPHNAHASWWSSIVDAAKNIAKKAIASVLGIDIEMNCPVPTATDADGADCLFCPLFKILFNGASFIANQSYNAFSSDLGVLVLVFLAVSLALIILKNLASFGAKEPGALMNDILKKTFICVTIYLIISQDYYHIINLTLTPIFNSGLSLVLNSVTTCANAGGIHGYSSTAGSGAGGGLPIDIGTSIVCSVEQIEHKIGLMFKYADWAMCRANGPDRWWLFIPNFIYIIDALFLYAGGILFMASYPWVLGDSVIQLGISAAILPFAICGYAFSGTNSYLKSMLSWILNSLFTFMFMAILLNSILTYIGDVLTGAMVNASGDPKVLFTSANQGIPFYGKNMMQIIFILFIGWSYMPAVKDLSSNFSSGSGITSAQDIGNKFRSSIGKQAKKVGNKVTDMATAGVKNVASNVHRIGKSSVRRTLIVAATYSPIHPFFKAKMGHDGKRYLQRSFTNYLTGRHHLMYSDKYMTYKKMLNSEGKLINSEVKFKKNFIKNHLIEKDDTINLDTFNAIINSPLSDEPGAREAIVAQVAAEYLAKKNIRVSGMFSARGIKFDPHNPYEISFDQVDNKGRMTTVKMKIDPKTGQVCIQHLVQTKGTYEMYIDNGYAVVKKSGKKTKGNILDGTATTSDEVTTTAYGSVVNANYKSLTAKFGGKEAIDEHGKVDSKIDAQMRFGLDDVFGKKTMVNSSGKTVSMDQYIIEDEFAVSRKNRTNRLRTHTDYNRNYSNVTLKDGTIVGTVDSSNVLTATGPLPSGSYFSGSTLYDSSGTPIGFKI